jgi:hypothetical protein
MGIEMLRSDLNTLYIDAVVIRALPQFHAGEHANPARFVSPLLEQFHICIIPDALRKYCSAMDGPSL